MVAMDDETAEPTGAASRRAERPGAAVHAGSLGVFGGQAAVHLHAGFDRSAHPMLIADNDRRWVTANAAGCALLGMELREVSWRAIDEFTAQHGRQRLEEQWPAFLRSGSAEGWYALDLPGRGAVHVEFSAIAHVLPGRHLAMFIVPHEGSFDEHAGASDDKVPWAAVVAAGQARAQLTRREREIIALIAAGGRGSDVAAQLFLSSETVKTHVHNAMVKLGARTRTHAVALALVTGQIIWSAARQPPPGDSVDIG